MSRIVKTDPPIRSPLLPRLAAVLGAIVCLWLGGFLQFITDLPSEIEDPDGETDAIIVLTGGAERLDTGLQLLINGKAKKLLVSGVDRVTTQAALLQRSQIDSAKFACCVELGHEASDTLGNAIEAEIWMRQAGYKSLRLVTASYHMPRSLLLFQDTMKGVEIVANPVFSPNVEIDTWWRHPRSAKLLASEFVKYVYSLLTVRLTGSDGVPGTQ